jgi:hypothetical protein
MWEWQVIVVVGMGVKLMQLVVFVGVRVDAMQLVWTTIDSDPTMSVNWMGVADIQVWLL